MGTLICIWDAPGVELATWPLVWPGTTSEGGRSVSVAKTYVLHHHAASELDGSLTFKSAQV